MKPSRDISGLVEIMAALRDRKSGCAWDIEQTFATIAPYTIEEAYEVAEAIAGGDMAELRDELGDLLLQVVNHARMAEESGAFAFADVVEAITTKLIRRHPHVFGDADALAAGAAKGFWEKAKAEERRARGEAGPGGLLDGVATALPALMRALKLQERAATVGFDWNDARAVLTKVQEEIGEIEAELAQSPRSTDRIEGEIGDLLFVVVNLARHLKVDADQALRRTNAKVTRRFRAIEAALAAEGRVAANASLAEMEALWQKAKAEE
ncbi:MAG: nucleoside triphosphate pyrophosphohydrolase [Bauldia sp.]